MLRIPDENLELMMNTPPSVMGGGDFPTMGYHLRVFPMSISQILKY